VSGYAVRRDTVVGHVALWLPVVRHPAVGFMVLLMSLAIRYEVLGIWFRCLFHTLRH